jgi:hypothetical protein
MNIFVYSDESGVFDKVHNDFFVFGGLIFLSKEERDIASRKYIHAENIIRRNYPPNQEMKASKIKNSYKGRLYRSLNAYYKFGVVIKQQKVLDSIYGNKKSKQRYLDYVYKIALKNHLKKLIHTGIINPRSIEKIYVYVDEHTTATDGKYELQQGLEAEFKNGTYNQTWDKFYPPIFPEMNDVVVKFCDSETNALIRASDIVANNFYYKAVKDSRYYYTDEKINIIKQP